MKPTVSQSVWYYPAEHGADEQPLAGIVTYVVGEGECVNLGVFAADGQLLPYNALMVPFVQDADAPEGVAYCTPVGQEAEKAPRKRGKGKKAAEED